MSDTYDLARSAGEKPPILALPLDAWHRARGGRMVEFACYHMPVQYEGILAEHLWTRAHAGLFDVSHMGQLVLRGANAAQALESLLPGAFATLKPGKQRYSLLLADDGGILDDLIVTNRGDHFYVVVNGATKHADIAHIVARLPEGVTLEHLESHALLALQGPEAAQALAALGLAVDSLVFMEAALFQWNGVALGVSRSGYTGEDGFEISVPAAQVEALADALLAQPQVKPIGLGARDSLRLEAGLPLYGHDLSPDIDPVEADLGFAIPARRRVADAGYPGAAQLAQAFAQGPARRRVGLLIEGRMAAREGAEVMADGRTVGTVTSGGFAPSLERPIAMAFVETALAVPGTALTLSVRGKSLAATVTPLPFIPHRYVRKGAA
ncbi:MULTISPECIES: glycine cleavage system aminomethyltransferase GcvT [unclassified Novosphingobium]|uniref:glycine cleavage system aminomethyltransferase GcvT n=1 Tax=unclassified Novosphingobium TaxID=2644732 RepID=UPI00146E325A|nr:aminomethyltransferase [Novosphingobium sp. SG919]NMN85755.1 aminomethyltransferase [Novosphingobium sp. SG916]